MIYLYNVSTLKDYQNLLLFFDKQSIAYRLLAKDELALTLRELERGKTADTYDGSVPEGASVVFSHWVDEEEATRLVNAFDYAGLNFEHMVMANEDMLDTPLVEVLTAHGQYRKFIKDIGYLQKLIEQVKGLNEKNYDPDLWSEMKFEIRDANEFLAGLASDGNDEEAEQQALSDEEMEKLHYHTEKLRVAMQKVLGRN